jgi:hypothetical protein
MTGFLRAIRQRRSPALPCPDLLWFVAFTALKNKVTAQIDGTLTGGRFADFVHHFCRGYGAETEFLPSMIYQGFVLAQDGTGFL